MTNNLRETLGSEIWVKENEDKLRELIPDIWTPMQKMSLLKVGFQLKLMGVMWTENEHLTGFMVWLEKVGIMQRHEVFIRRNPNRIFKVAMKGN